MQLPPEPLTRGLPPQDPRSLCPQLNLLKPPRNKIPGYATALPYTEDDAWRQVLPHVLMNPCSIASKLLL